MPLAPLLASRAGLLSPATMDKPCALCPVRVDNNPLGLVTRKGKHVTKGKKHTRTSSKTNIGAGRDTARESDKPNTRNAGSQLV